MGQFNGVSQPLLRRPVAMVTKTYRILTENCYNSACRRDMSPILAPNIGFSGSVNLTTAIYYSHLTASFPGQPG